MLRLKFAAALIAVALLHGCGPATPMRPDVSARRALWQGWRGATTYLEVEEKELAELEASGATTAVEGLRARVESARAAAARFRADSIRRYGVPPEELAE
jgi:hypothetical protein